MNIIEEVYFMVETLRNRLHYCLGNVNSYFMGSFVLNRLIDLCNKDSSIDIVVKDLETKNKAIVEIVNFVGDTSSSITELSVIGNEMFNYWKVVIDSKESSNKILVNIFINSEFMEDSTFTCVDKLSSSYRYAGIELYAAWCVSTLVYGNTECIYERLNYIIDLYLIDDYITFPEDFNKDKYRSCLEKLGVVDIGSLSALEDEMGRFDYFSSCVGAVIDKDYTISEDGIEVLKSIGKLIKCKYDLG